MIASVCKKVFGSRNERLLRQYSKVVKQINDLEATVKKFSDQDFKNKTLELKEKVKNDKF